MSKELYSGGDGLTKDNPVVVNADNSWVGIPAEYAYISSIHGDPRTGAWERRMQRLLETEDGGHMDQLDIVLADGTEKSYFFDINQFFGKF